MTEKEFDILLELSGLMVDDGEREAMMEDVESILGYVSQLPTGTITVDRAAVDPKAAKGRPIDELRPDEADTTHPTEIEAVRKAFPASTRDGLLEVQGVFGSKDV